MPNILRDAPILIGVSIAEWWSNLPRKDKKLACFVAALGVIITIALLRGAYWEAAFAGIFFVVGGFVLLEPPAIRNWDWIREELQTLGEWCFWPQVDFWLLYRRDPEVAFARSLIGGLAVVGTVLQALLISSLFFGGWIAVVAAAVLLLVITVVRGLLHAFGVEEDEMRRR